MRTRVRDHLGDVADPNKANSGTHWAKSWTPIVDKRLDDTALLQHLSPEETCMLESALYAEQQLRDIHINRLHDPAGLDKLYDKLKGNAEERLQKKALAIFIEEELQLTPWTLTANFHAYKHGRCLLTLRGAADPSGCGEGHAYTKLNVRERLGEEDEEEKRRRREEKKKVVAPKQLTGTDSDLRKLRKEDCIAWLAPHGYSREQVLALSRWDRTSLIRQIDTQQTGEGYEGKFARNESSSRGQSGSAKSELALLGRYPSPPPHTVPPTGQPPEALTPNSSRSYATAQPLCPLRDGTAVMPVTTGTPQVDLGGAAPLSPRERRGGGGRCGGGPFP